MHLVVYMYCDIGLDYSLKIVRDIAYLDVVLVKNDLLLVKYGVGNDIMEKSRQQVTYRVSRIFYRKPIYLWF